MGHTILRYLSRSATFVYTLLKFQQEFRPFVFAETTLNLDEFPIDSLYELTPGASLDHRLARRLGAALNGYATTQEHRLTRLARESGCAILHAHFGWAGSRALPVARRLGLPLVTTFYGRDVSDRHGFPYAGLFEHGAAFMCEGPAMARHLASVGCPSEKIRVVPIGIDISDFDFAVNRRSKPFVVLQAGRFVEKKGIDVSLKAFAAARAEIGPSELWLVGDGELRPELEALAAALGLVGAVRFFGMVSHDRYRSIARRAHAFIQPSRTAADGDTEGGAPTVLLEAQALGLPVVATRHADIPWVVPDPELLQKEEDVDGLAERLVEIASLSDGEYGTRARRGRDFIEARHDARRIAAAIADVYREALDLPEGIAA